MKILILFFLLPFQLFSFAQQYQYKPAVAVIMDTSTKKEMLYCCSRECPDSITGVWQLTSKEINILGQNFKKILFYETELCCGNSKINSLTPYAFQYLGVIRNEKKLIFINSVAKSILKYYPKFKKQNKHPMMWCDGGKDFWAALFDPEKKEFIFLAINGR
jgi:hypothetical protein